MSAEEPYIYHYTFGVEYSLEGFPMPGAVGEWSLDKRREHSTSSRVLAALRCARVLARHAAPAALGCDALPCCALLCDVAPRLADARHYFGAYPPRSLDAPPKCAKECAFTWWSMFNEVSLASI